MFLSYINKASIITSFEKIQNIKFKNKNHPQALEIIITQTVNPCSLPIKDFYKLEENGKNLKL